MKEELIEQIEHYSTILDDYISKRFKYTINTEDLEDEIKVVAAYLLETIEEYKETLIKEEN